MKKFTSMLLIAIALSPIAALADRKTTDRNELPKSAQTFLDQHFKGKKLVVIEVDLDSYEAKLDEGIEVEFTKAGDWKQVKSYAGVPAILIPKPISDYATQKHVGTTIVKITKKVYGFEIELNNDIDIEFNRKGIFLSYDN